MTNSFKNTLIKDLPKKNDKDNVDTKKLFFKVDLKKIRKYQKDLV